MGGGCALGPFPVYRTRSAQLCFPISCDVSWLPGDCLFRAVILSSVTGKMVANQASSFSDSYSPHVWCALKNLKRSIYNYWEIKTSRTGSTFVWPACRWEVFTPCPGELKAKVSLLAHWDVTSPQLWPLCFRQPLCASVISSLWCGELGSGSSICLCQLAL